LLSTAAPFGYFIHGVPALAQSFAVNQVSGEAQLINLPTLTSTMINSTSNIHVDAESKLPFEAAKIKSINSVESESISNLLEKTTRSSWPDGFYRGSIAPAAIVINNAVSTSPLETKKSDLASPNTALYPEQSSLLIQNTFNSTSTSSFDRGSAVQQALWNAENTLYKLDSSGACALNRQSTTVRLCH
jgi:hypothetical protein